MRCASAWLLAGLPLWMIAQTAQSSATTRMRLADDRGRVFAPTGQPPRLVSVMPALTEALFATGRGGRLVAASNYCDHPPAAAGLPKIGGPLDPNYERILALKPDRVLVMDMVPGPVQSKLSSLGLPVVYLREPRTLAEISRWMTRVDEFGRTMGEMDAPPPLAIGAFDAELARLTVPGSPRTGCLIVSPGQPLWTAGRDTFLDDLLKTAGCRNLAADYSGWAAIELEQIAKLRPDWLLYLGKPAAPGSPLDRLVRARKLKTLVLDENSASRPGPRILAVLRQVETALGTLPAHEPATGPTSQPPAPDSPPPAPHAP